MLNDPVLTEPERLEICVYEDQVIGDPYRMCHLLSKEIRELRDKVEVNKGTYKTLDYLYDTCQQERVWLRNKLRELEAEVSTLKSRALDQS